MFPQVYAPTVVQSHSSMFQQLYQLFHIIMFQQLENTQFFVAPTGPVHGPHHYVLTAILFPNSKFQQPYSLISLCSNSCIVPQFYVPAAV